MDSPETRVEPDFTDDMVDLEINDARVEPRSAESTPSLLDYPCDSCDLKASSAEHLVLHKLSAHPETMHPCDHCQYVGAHKKYLKRHIQRCHPEGKLFPCSSCDFTATTTQALKDMISGLK